MHRAIDLIHRALAREKDGMIVSQLAIECGLGQGYVIKLLKAMRGAGVKLVGRRWHEDWSTIEAAFRPENWDRPQRTAA